MSDEIFKPSLPYAGTSGWSGSETSRKRALNADVSGLTSHNQRLAMDLLEDYAAEGMTYFEFGLAVGKGHGTTSGVLSDLHKDGRIARLRETRNNRKVYVLHEWVNGRETEEHLGNKPRCCPNCGHEF